MPRTKQSTTTASVAVVQRRKTATKLEYEPVTVMVRALRRGQYGVKGVVEAKWKDEQNRIQRKKELGRDAIIYNEGEVFEMDVADMRKWPLSLYGDWQATDEPVVEGYKKVGTPRELPHSGAENTEIINVNGQEYELPSWVTLADGEAETSAAGHSTTFGNRSDVL